MVRLRFVPAAIAAAFLLITACGDDAGSTSGGTVTSSSASSSTGGTSSSSASSSTTGQGGQGPTCETPNDCALTTTSCTEKACENGMCSLAPKPAGTPAVNDEIPGDCQLAVCDGQGTVVLEPDDLDVPDDQNDCTVDACAQGTPTFDPEMAGAPCMSNGGTICDGMGACIVGPELLNGCSLETADDLTATAMVTVTFPALSYTPKCIKVSAGTQVTFQGNFATHPLQGGYVVGNMLFPAAAGPFVPVTDTGMSKTFTMTSTGDFPYYCQNHALAGMTGVVFVVP